MKQLLKVCLAVILVGVVCAAGFLILANRGVLGRARLADLTEDQLYTLSDGTRGILEKLSQPIELRLYYTRTGATKSGRNEIRYWNDYYLYVRDLLDEYVRLADGKISLTIVDPRPFSDEEEEALKYGLRRFQLTEDEGFFFGLVAKTELGKDKVIEFFEPQKEATVEYDISKTILQLVQRDKKKIGVYSSLPVMGTEMSPYMMQMMQMTGRRPEKPWVIAKDLEQAYEVVRIESKAKELPGDLDFLIVVHPKDVNAEMQYAIDQYVMHGGKLMVFTDPHCLVDQPQRNPRNPMAGMNHKSASDLNVLLENWGVQMMTDEIAVDRKHAVRAQVQQNQNPELILPYLNLNEEVLSQDEVITASLHSVKMLFPGKLTKVLDRGTDVRPLLTTSDVGTTWKPKSPFELRMFQPKTVRDSVSDGSDALMLGCVITGKMETNFPDGPPEPTPEAPPGPGGMPPGAGGMPPMPPPMPPPADDDDGHDHGADDAADETDKADAAAAPAADTDKADAAAAPAADTDKAGGADEVDDLQKSGGSKEDANAGKAADAAREHLKTAKKGAIVVVFADVDMITDPMAYQQTFYGFAQAGDNAPLLFNTIDYLSGSEDLIKIRTRAEFRRPFTVIKEIEDKAQEETDKEVKKLQEEIENYEKELQELGKSATSENMRLIQNEALKKRREVEEKIREANKRLRKLQAKRRERVEAVEGRIKMANMLAAPLLVLLIAIVLGSVRFIQRRQHAARRA